MPSRIAELEVFKQQRDLVLKPLDCSVFAAPMTVTPPTQITEGAGATLSELPTGFYDAGLLDKDDAVAWARAMETSDLNAVGYRDPVRSDITSDVFNLTFKGMETNKVNIENYLNVDLGGVTPTAQTGEIAFDQPASARLRQQRYLCIGQDGIGADTIYVARLIYCGQTSDPQDQSLGGSDGYLNWGYTVNSRVDTTAKVSVRHFFGGPGWKALLEEAGFPALSA
ncbi:hypothetical protein GCM10027047_01670 [Rhodococcus aerolatus]